MNVVIVGGHGKVAMRLAQVLSKRANTKVLSIIRNTEHSQDVASTGATPLVLSLEDDSKEKFTEVFEGKDVVYFAAGAGGKGGPERALTVDRDGALKVFDALEDVKGEKPRLILLSAMDVRDRTKPAPAHYTETDVKASDEWWKAIGWYFEAKYQADRDLVTRTAFKWTILRPGFYSDEPGTGRVIVGKAPLPHTISRDDVAQTLALLINRPDAAGLGIDVVKGNDIIAEALDTFIKKGESDFLG